MMNLEAQEKEFLSLITRMSRARERLLASVKSIPLRNVGGDLRAPIYFMNFAPFATLREKLRFRLTGQSPFQV
jgi:hypothetical protein